MGPAENHDAGAGARTPRKLGRVTGWVIPLIIILAAAALMPAVATDYFFSDSYKIHHL